MEILKLNGKWEGRYILPGEAPVLFEAIVPGCAHTDLLRAGLIPDYFQGYHSRDCQFIENAYFTYERTFSFEGNTQDMRLIFQGLDTFCDIFLNGSRLGYCDNMFLPHAFDVSSILKSGDNRLSIQFYPPVKQVEGYPPLSMCFTEERAYIRRMQCTFGWDWVDRFVTVGVIGDVMLQRVTSTMLDSLYVSTTHLDSFGAEVMIQADFERVSGNDRLELAILSPEGDKVWQQGYMVAEPTMHQRVSISNPSLWFPRGYGLQPLYRLIAKVFSSDNRILEEKEIRFGIRTLRLLELTDPEDSSQAQMARQLKKQPHLQAEDHNESFTGFTVLVNGNRIFCKGANWVPCEPFPSEACPEKYHALLELAAGAHINILRVWGGGLFEKEAFYEACDRLGILVEQDFLMACGHYPETEEWFLDHLRREAVHAAKTLRNHPCLAWWNGDNENSAAGSLETADYWGRKAANLAVGPLLRQMDPYRPFIPSSPYGGIPFKSVTSGLSHNTVFLEWFHSVVQNTDLSDYQKLLNDSVTRFCNELPTLGTPSLSSLIRFMEPGNPYDEDCLRYHTKSHPAFDTYDTQAVMAEKILGTFQDDSDKLLKMQYVQYEWVRCLVEAFRRNKWYSSGLLFWMYNDCWPANSWSFVDYYANPKAGYYAFKRTAQPVACSIERSGESYKVYLLNDTLNPVHGNARLYIQGMAEPSALWEVQFTFETAANESAVIWCGDLPLPDTGAVLLCDIQAGEYRDRVWYFPRRLCDVGMPSSTGKQCVEVVEQDSKQITLRALCYVQAVALDGDYCFKDNFFPMLPGETRTIVFSKTYDAGSDDIIVGWL